MEGSLSCPVHQGGIKDDLCVFSGGGGGGSDHGSSVESSCLSAAPASSNDVGLVDQEGHPSHLDDMSSLMAQLPPLRRGLSRFYGGKSQSFTSLSSAKAMEDLPEPDRRRRRRRSGCKKQMMANMHGSSNLSKVIRKVARMGPPSRSPSGVSFVVCSSAPQ